MVAVKYIHVDLWDIDAPTYGMSLDEFGHLVWDNATV